MPISMHKQHLVNSIKFYQDIEWKRNIMMDMMMEWQTTQIQFNPHIFTLGLQKHTMAQNYNLSLLLIF